MNMKIVYLGIAVLVIIITIVVVVYILMKKEKKSSSNVIEIIQEPTKSFGLDEYTVYKGDDEILKSGGTWELANKNLYFIIGKEKVKVNTSNHSYVFTYQNNVSINGNNIVIDNYKDEIRIIKDGDGYKFMRDNIEIAEVKYIRTNRAGEKIYNLEMYKSENYLYIYLISFVILNQIEKDLNISLD